MRQFKIGDRVRSRTEDFTGTIVELNSGGGGSVKRDDNVHGGGVYINGYGDTWAFGGLTPGMNSYDLVIIEEDPGLTMVPGQTSTESKIMTLIDSFKGLFTSEPQKSFKKAGVTNDAGDLTEEGAKVFRAWLFQKYADEFKKEVVDQILAEQDKK